MPPTQPFGALIAGYVRASMLDRALVAMREFCRQGGVPDPRMVQDIVPLCLAMGNYRQAMQVGGWHAAAAPAVLCHSSAPTSSVSLDLRQPSALHAGPEGCAQSAAAS